MRSKIYACEGRVKVRRFRRSDAKERLAWPPYTDLLFTHLNYRLSTFVDRERWLLARMTDTGRIYFAVEDEKGHLIGEMSLREIDADARTSRLGVHLASNKLGQGYGREALSALLDHYFNRMRYDVLYLDVAAHNKRALRLYESLHFRHLSPFWRLAPTEVPVFTDEAYAELRRFFRLRGSALECLYHDMCLTKKVYFEARRQPKPSAGRTPIVHSEGKRNAESPLLQE
ncbi:MAG: GNAT family N-acetyltransferase [Planctomycetes bacterium]|nr:GNAT family N-acetyltransferase [Planctomycetota bacterium]